MEQTACQNMSIQTLQLILNAKAFLDLPRA